MKTPQQWRDLEIGDIIQNGDRFIVLACSQDGQIFVNWRTWEKGDVPFNSHHPIIQRKIQ